MEHHLARTRAVLHPCLSVGTLMPRAVIAEKQFAYERGLSAATIPPQPIIRIPAL
jgi:hypothetical protein